MTTTVIVALIVAVAGRFMADELKAWFGWLHKMLRRRALNGLPAECRERYDEEWESGLEEIPGEIFKLLYSIGLLRAAVGIRTASLVSNENFNASSAVLKRIFDIAFSSASLLLLLPFMFLISIAIKLESGGSVLYFSDRVGKNGRAFRLPKFCALGRSSENVLVVTGLGRVLRKYALDELPQFISVLRGDMSVVGPRPLLRGGLHDDHAKTPERLKVAPGVTGLWQLQGKENHSSDTSSLYENPSIWLDLKIIARTVAMPFLERGDRGE